MRLYKIVTGMGVLALLFNIAAQSAYSQGVANKDKTITAVRVSNNKAISAETVLSKLKVKVGDQFSQDALNDDLKRLYATEYFTDVSIDVQDYQDGIAVTFIVDEKPVIDDIVFKGNTAFKAHKLKSMMKSKPNDMLNLAVLAQDIAEIKNFYVKKGYPLAEVKYVLDLDKEPNKARITVTIDEKMHVKVTRINIAGNKAIKTNVLRKMLGTKPAWLFNPGIFNEDILKEDTEKIKYLYDDIGYLDAEVTPKFDYSLDGTSLEITININEGKLYVVGNIAISGNLVLPEKDIKSKITMKTDKPFSNRALRMDASAIRQYYYEFGYMNAIVEVERDLNQATGKIDVTYNIDAGEPVYIGKIEVKGNIKTKDIVVRRELRVYPGERFNGGKIKRSKERIYNLGFFENVSFDTEPTETPDIQNLIVTLKETKTGEFSFGGGYSSIDLLVGFAEITQKNFDILNFPTFTGGGQNLAIRGEVGMVRNNFNVSWTDPWIFGWPFSFGFDAYQTTHNKRGDVGWSYDEERTGGDARLGKEFTDYIRGDLTYRLEQVRITDVIDNASKDMKDEAGRNWISSLMAELTLDTRDNIFSPGKGYTLSGSIENAGGIILGDKDYVKGTASAMYYHTFFQVFVMELKARMGLEAAYGDSGEVPIYERFYAGGANTIRGYKERRVGPRDPGSDEPIGGEAILIGNAELTFPVYEKIIKGAVFCDVGNVWRRSEDFMAGGKLKSGVGVGARVKTPIGPVRIDYGYPLVGNYDDERTGEFYFSMSRGF
ncbi:MAG: outer membrane protein assembly factor BamA [Candidatus Omnitrophota bacterium]|nr:outer membrane protein assembly factor BamA [Candidatus Omnitrophota bacterium]